MRFLNIGARPNSMTYKVLSLKWRPRVFEDIVGQTIYKNISNAFKKIELLRDIFSLGQRGWKTTTARILSMALNVDGGPNFNFDPDSNTSIEISESRSLDVIEIDGASNRGIEEIETFDNKLNLHQ